MHLDLASGDKSVIARGAYYRLPVLVAVDNEHVAFTEDYFERGRLRTRIVIASLSGERVQEVPIHAVPDFFLGLSDGDLSWVEGRLDRFDNLVQQRLMLLRLGERQRLEVDRFLRHCPGLAIGGGRLVWAAAHPLGGEQLVGVHTDGRYQRVEAISRPPGENGVMGVFRPAVAGELVAWVETVEEGDLDYAALVLWDAERQDARALMRSSGLSLPVVSDGWVVWWANSDEADDKPAGLYGVRIEDLQAIWARETD